MALDYGGKRTGIAVTDPLQIIATPLDTVNTADLMEFLGNYLREEDVEMLVIGQPTRHDGSFSDIEKEILKFIDQFSKTHPHLPLRRINEMYTSKQAMQALIDSGVGKKKRKDKKLLDSTSATIILQEIFSIGSMIYPIRAFGDPVLRSTCEEIGPDYPNLKELLDNMFQTMDASDGVGLAAPQIGKSIRLFLVDSTHFKDRNEGRAIRQAFINPVILEEEGEEWAFEEGCLSIPDIREDVNRQPVVKMRYMTPDFEEKTEVFKGLTARVIQHEYDHIEGVLFTDHLSAFKKQLLKSKLANISKGKVNVHYRMKFPKRK